MEAKVCFEKEMFFFRIPPSPFSQRELHLSHQASLQWSLRPLRFPQFWGTETSGTRGCSWLCYSAARVLVSQRSLFNSLYDPFGSPYRGQKPKGLAGSAYAIKLRLLDATELRLFVGWRIA